MPACEGLRGGTRDVKQHCRAESIQRALPSTTVSLSYLAVPAWGLTASTLWLGEALPAGLVLGGLLILLGVAAIAIADTRRR